MKLKLAVLFGGKSVEHEISVISALQACAALDREKYDVLPVYLTKENAFYIGDNVGKIEAYRDIPALLASAQQVIPGKIGGKAVLLRWPSKAFGKNVAAEIECVLPVVHGTNAEDGTLQGLLRLLDVPFAGCDVAASAVGMDKYVQKCVFRDNGIPVLDCVCLHASEDYAVSEKNEKLKAMGFPLIVKPVNLGSSVGITKAEDAAAFGRALDLAFRFSEKVLIEPAVQNLREINCAVLGDASEARASVCEEPLNADEILSYENKYLSGGKAKSAKLSSAAAQPASSAAGGMASLERKIPADIPEELAKRVQALAVQAFRCLDCNGTARIDFLLNSGTGELWLNEINTIPGSLSFYLWEATGMPYTELLKEMIRLAFRRERTREDLNFSFDTNVLANANFSGGKKS